MKKKPEVGQWWVNVVDDPPRVYKTGIVLFVGRDSKGRLLWEDCQGRIETDYGCDWSDWHHEPACTGWDWVAQDKEEYPQWYSDKDGAFTGMDGPYLIRCDSETEQVFLYRSGKVEKVKYPWRSDEYADNLKSGHWKKLSQQEADEALHPKKLLSPDVVNDLAASIRKEQNCNRFIKEGYNVVVEEVLEGPEDWVTQDLVRVRVGVDEFRYTNPGWRDPWEWRLAQENDNWTPEALHGFTDEDGNRLELRCRRKDLPGAEAKVVKSPAEDPGEGYRFVRSDEVVLETDERAYVDEDSEKNGLFWGKVSEAGWFENGKTAGDLRPRRRGINVVFRRKATDTAKVATVTVYQILYGDDLNQMLHRFVIAEHAVEHLKHNWKYVSVVSTKTVEVMLDNVSCNAPHST